jgi:hypothetical protein
MMLPLTKKEADDLITILVSGRAGLRDAATNKRRLGLSGDKAERLAAFSEELSGRILKLRKQA